MIVKVGGTNGSGKTTLMRAFLALWDFKPVLWPGKTKVQQYEARIAPGQPLADKFKRVVVLGSYENVCGGMDTISDKNDRFGLVEPYCSARYKDTLVLFEGLITGTTYGALGALGERSKVPWVYLFMDTPYEVCLERVLTRRAARGTETEFDGIKTLHPKIKACVAVAGRATAAGKPVIWVDHRKSGKAQAALLVKQIGKLA